MVFTSKVGRTGEEQKKVRVVAKGYSQQPGIDFHETFSPTAHMDSLCMEAQVMVEQV